MIELRPYQTALVDQVRANLRQHRRCILQSQTGSGKTKMAQWMLANAAARNPSGRYGFAVHRRGLVDNASDSFDDLPHGVIMSGVETMPGQSVQVASIDTLLSWYVDETGWKHDFTFDLLVFDECHSHLAKLMKMAGAMDKRREELGLPQCCYVGLSATPRCQGINWFRSIVHGPSCEWLQEQGYAAKFSYYGATKGQLGQLVKRGREFTKDSVSKAFDGLGGALVRDWKRIADGVPTVGFFPRLEQAREAMRLLREAGVRAAYVDGNTKDEKRRKVYDQLDNREIDYICNVGVIERGTDLGVGCVQLCTAVGKEERYMQMIGRGSRVNEHAKECIVIDHGGNIARHGFWEDVRDWSLDWSAKKAGEQGTRATVECPGCGRAYRGGACTVCGHEPTKRELKQQGLEFDGSDMVQIDRKSKPKPKPKSDQIMARALAIAGKSGKSVGQAVAMAYGIAEREGVRDFRVPDRIYNKRMPRRDDFEWKRLASQVFPWTARRK